MIQALDTRAGMTCYAVTSGQELPLPALLDMLNASWQADYTDTARLALDAAYLQELMEEVGAVSILIYDAAGQIAAFELARQRTLYCRQQPLRAYYNTLFTVSASHRRQGIGRWMLHCINRLLFDERQADVVFVTFHSGHAGLPTVQNTHAPIADWGVQVFHTAAVWGKRLDLRPLAALETPPMVARLAWLPGEAALTPMPVAHTPVPQRLPTVETLTTALSTHYEVAFGLGESFRSRYLRHDIQHAGTFWYDFGPQAHCCLSFDMVPLVCNTHRLGLLGRLQAVHVHQCTGAHLVQALHHLCGVFQEHGCFLAGALDHGVLPHEVFQALGFRAIDDTRMFAVRGPQAAIQAFATVRAPFFLDL